MKIFFDTEFTGLHKNTSLISIGCVSEYGETFYADISDFPRRGLSNWIKENVIANTILLSKSPSQYLNFVMENMDEDHKYIMGSLKKVKEYFVKWIDEIRRRHHKHDKILFISDVSHYDMVLLVDLITCGGEALDLPKYITPVVYDINQLIFEKENKKDSSFTMYNAFDLNRESLLSEDFDPGLSFDLKKHNSLWDALVIKDIYETYSKEEEDEDNV